MILTDFLIIFAFILAAVFIVLYILLKVNIRSIASQLKYINEEETNARVRIHLQDHDIKELIILINKSIEEKKDTEAKYKKMDMELRRAIANVSHDLRTPLTSIVGYVELMEDKDISEDEKRQYLDVVKRRTKSLQMLISGFYDLSRLDSNEYELELRLVNLSNILCDIIASFYNDFINNGVEPSIDIDDKSGEVIGNENAVRRVFSNLIQNMLRYGKNNVFISLKKSDDFIITVFRNDAYGLTKEDASHLFERFFRANRARNGKGTGLGLAIAKRLVEKMGHSISSELKDNKLSIIIKWKV